ncbi:MAG: STAS domain-containing protein [Chloroflexia bacterium]|nr:STAS domain-containing protein [Chloroflexia bacterium]
MEITKKALNRVYYITVEGRLDAETTGALDEAVDEAMDQGFFRIVLNLEGVPYISSRGLKTLIRVRKATRRFNRGDLRLVNPQAKIKEVLEFTGLLPLFPIYDDAVEAVGSF